MRKDHAGMLRHRMVLERRANTSVDDRGHPTDPWARVRTVRASYRQLSGTETERMRQVAPSATVRIRIRTIRDESIQNDLHRMRLLWRGRYFYIGGASDTDGDRRFTDLYCSEDKTEPAEAN